MVVALAGNVALAQHQPSASNNDSRRVITTGVPFLSIGADARSAGMADIGVASSVDAFSQQYNPAKYVFSKKQQGFALSYTPYMTKISGGINLAQLNYFNKIDERSAIAGSLRYFGLGETILKENIEDPGRAIKPGELALDVSYSLKLSDNFSGAVAARFINSNLKLPNQGESSASSFAVDIAGFYESDVIRFDDFDGVVRAGFNLQNLGPKISYSETDSQFLPSTLRLGGGFDFILDEENKVSAYTEFTKLMVPTPQSGDRYSKNSGWTKGIFSSFTDAPGGISEEFSEITWALGAEYWYKDAFAFRTGYFHEAQSKGARQYATIGAGFKYNQFTLDVSYLFATSKVQNPLDNTLRFSLTFNFGKNYNK